MLNNFYSRKNFSPSLAKRIPPLNPISIHFSPFPSSVIKSFSRQIIVDQKTKDYKINRLINYSAKIHTVEQYLTRTFQRIFLNNKVSFFIKVFEQGWPTPISLWAATWKICQKYFMLLSTVDLSGDCYLKILTFCGTIQQN